MTEHAERGMSAPPEVVFSTATDPDRVAGWLPEQLRTDGDQRPEVDADRLSARWGSASAPGWSAEIQVEPAAAGGARVRLDLAGDPGDQVSDGLADRTLENLARTVADNLTAG
ncbi:MULTISPECIES: hypothetical protein [Micromonospora]|uniref:Polyketide cyclase / dehydrase and lipid transport n=1 Tax=Micromonospora yangpuensis TaxID=683228 RepID=A0A1C6V7C2_9ACTN|nr:hypothetical protein [Micromonospora yangpuensis]GGM18896.1 hypothetical protein GCM10012279_41570 [Micromonospora yangpuensis]SCL61790.1 hypothetical protein GA0070617_4765 [Micromonospora yangpuensis]